MRIAIIGASGNAGTARLHALHDEPAVTEIVGVARRVPPHRPPAPAYDGVRWEQIDISLPVVDAHAENLLVNRLSEAIAEIGRASCRERGGSGGGAGRRWEGGAEESVCSED